MYQFWFICQFGRATFPPSVWSQLPEPDDFLLYLKNRGGLD